jgi:hypothetical protein
MKKIFYVLLTLSLIFSLCCVSAFASPENADDPANEQIDHATTVVEGDEDSTVTDVDSIIDKLTDSTLWINIGTVAVACLGIIGTVASKFKNIASLIARKADTNTVIDAVKDSNATISKAFADELEKVNKKLAEAKDTEDKLYTILVLFITNAKINPTAKAEIMKLLTGAKNFGEDPDAVIAAVNKAIEDAVAAEEKVDTPALDAITTMDLG